MGLKAAGVIRKIAAPLLRDKAVPFEVLALDVASGATKYAIGITSGLATKGDGTVRFLDVSAGMFNFCGNLLKSFGYSAATTEIMLARDGEPLPIKAITAAKRAATIAKVDIPESICSADEPYPKRRAIAREFIEARSDTQPAMTAKQLTAIINMARSPVCDIMCDAIRMAAKNSAVTEHTLHSEGEATAFYLALEAVRGGKTNACIVANDTDVFGLMLANWEEISKMPDDSGLWYYDMYTGKYIHAGAFCKAVATTANHARAVLFTWMMRGTDYFPPCLGEKVADHETAYATIRAYFDNPTSRPVLESYLSSRLNYHGALCKTATFIPHSGKQMLNRLLTTERVFRGRSSAEMPDFFAPDSGWGLTTDGLCVPREHAVGE